MRNKILLPEVLVSEDDNEIRIKIFRKRTFGFIWTAKEITYTVQKDENLMLSLTGVLISLHGRFGFSAVAWEYLERETGITLKYITPVGNI